MDTHSDSGVDPLNLVGETVAERFHLERAVAEGGFGVVYRARDIGLGRPVALKVLKAPSRPDAAEAAAFRRSFEAEARIVAQLQHPNIVAVHDFGVSTRGPDPLHWIALEWLEGRTLEALLCEQRCSGGRPRIDPAGALALMRPLLEAVAFAHQRGVVHGDLKPANIFLHEQAGRQVGKVLDFGIARIMVREGDGGVIANTTRRPPAFSPDYAAPEQVIYGRIGPWTDVHALALILTELLTGTPPYGTASADGEREGRFEQIIGLQRPTPGSKGIGVDGWERVLAMALARRPADRHPDAGALLADLERHLPDPTPAAMAVSGRPRARGRLAPLLLATLAIVGLVAGLVVPRRSVPRPAPIGRLMVAVLPFDNLTGDRDQEYFSDGLTDEMIGHLGRLRPDRLAVIARTSIVQYKTHRKSIKEIGRELAVAYVLEGSVKRASSRVRVAVDLVNVSDETQVWSASYDGELKDIVALQSNIARTIAAEMGMRLDPPPAAPPSSRAPDPAAYEAYLRGRFFLARWGDGKGTFMQAGPYLERAIALAPSYAAAHAALAEYLGPRGLELGARAKEAAMRAVELDDALPEAHRALANVLLAYEWDWAGAERHYRRALALAPNDGQSYQLWARIPLATGRFAEAIAARKRGIELSPLSWDAQVQLASAYYMARQYDDAAAQLQRILAANPDLGPAHLFLGAVHVHERRYTEAMAEGALCGPACNGRVTGVALARLGRAAEAIAALGELKAGMEREPTDGNPQISWSIEAARVYAALGRRDEAFDWLERALVERSRDLIFLRVDEQWDPLRADPRFDALIRRVGIPRA